MAFCADCMGKFVDKVFDCNNKNCPLYPHMPYNSKNKSSETESDDEGEV